MKKTRSFRHALTANFILLSCVPVLLFGVLILYLWEDHLQTMAEDNSLRLVNEVRSDAQFFLVEARRELEQIGTVLDQPQTIHDAKLDDYLSAVVNKSLSFEAVMLLDPSWKVSHLGIAGQKVGQRRDFVGLDMSRHELLEAGALDQPRWSKTFLSLVSGKPTVTLGVPLSHGVLLGNVSLANLSQMITRLVHSSDHVYLAILDQDKTVIASNSNEEIFAQVNFGFHPEITRAMENEGHTSVDVHRSKRMIESVVKLKETGWVVWVGQELDTVMAPAHVLSRTLILFLVGAIVLSLLVALRKSKLLMAPISALQQKTVEIASGSYPRGEVDSHYREIEALSAGMQEMSGAIAQREENLRESEQRFRLIFSLNPDPTILARLHDGIIIDVNEVFLRETGLLRENVLGQELGKLQFWAEPRQQELFYATLRQKREVRNLEVKMRLAKGEQDILISATLLHLDGVDYLLGMLRDISEIRQAEALLQASEARYRTVVEAIEEGLLVFDEGGVMVAFNAAAERLLGPREKYLNSSYRNWSDKLLCSDGSQCPEQRLPVVRSLLEGETVRNELMGVSRGETETAWLEVNSSPLHDGEGGQIKGAVVTFVDVTESLHRKELLENIVRGIGSQTGTEFFTSLTRHLSRALAADYVLVSEVHPDKPGYFRSISVSTPWGVGDNIEYAQQGTPCFEAVSADVCAYPRDVQRLFPDDQLLVEMGVHAYIGRALHNEQGESIGLVAVMYQRPIAQVALTEQLLQIFAARAEAELMRRRSVEALQVSEKQLRRLSNEFEALLEGIPDQILLVDRDYRLIWANHNPNKEGGGDDEHCYQIFYGNDEPCDSCPVRSAFASGETEESDFTDEEGQHFLMRAVPILDAEGRVEKVIQMVQDVTEKVRLQQQQQHTRQLAALGELAAGVAHEINNPVNGIINYAQLIQNRFGDNESLRGLSERVIKEGNRIATIVGELLYFAREGGDEVRVTSWQQIVEESLLLVGNQLRKDHIELSVDIEPDLPAIHSITTQLQQVVLNLFSNARHALNEKYPEANPGKRLQIVGRRGEKGMVELEITDFGPGIPESTLEKVLQPFYTTKPAGVGTGLGLSICHEIITRHGGSITLTSEAGSFTRVLLVLPAATGGQEQPSMAVAATGLAVEGGDNT